jgi:hypothetical protein
MLEVTNSPNSFMQSRFISILQILRNVTLYSGLDLVPVQYKLGASVSRNRNGERCFELHTDEQLDTYFTYMHNYRRKSK